MSRKGNAPVVIKRKKITRHDDHHGGAWKVAFADFATAMMAFFLIMWLITAATDTQRMGLADYFAPSIPISRTSGGLDGLLGGQDMAPGELMAEIMAESPPPAVEDAALDPKSPEALEERLLGWGGESSVIENALRHVVTRITDEGLIVELMDLPDRPLFDADTGEPRPVLRLLADMIAEVFATVENELATAGHTRAYPLIRREPPAWDLSTERAHRMRELLEAGGLAPDRLMRVTGHGERSPARDDPQDIRNNRLEVLLLREG